MTGRRSLTLRWRWALWCAALVTATGVVAVVVLLAVTSRMLRDRNAEAAGLDPSAPRPAASAPSGTPPPSPPGPGGPVARVGLVPLDEQMRRGGDVAESTIRDVRTIGIAMVGGFALLSLGIGWWVAGRMLRPLHAVTRVADDVAGGRFGARIDLDGPRDELRQMADAFDTMLDRLDAAFDAQRSFVADASHELRTPLTVMRAEIDVALDDPTADAAQLREALAASREEMVRTTRLVESLLALSRSEVLVDVEDHDLTSSVQRSVAAHLGDRAGVHVDLRPAPVRGDGLLVDRIVDNLVQNAARYSPPDGRIEVSTGVAGRESFVRVVNDGERIDETEVAALFERFHRRDGARNPHAGAGLGLAVVRAAVRTHGGTVLALPRGGGGLDITVHLPRTPGMGSPDSG